MNVIPKDKTNKFITTKNTQHWYTCDTAISKLSGAIVSGDLHGIVRISFGRWCQCFLRNFYHFLSFSSKQLSILSITTTLRPFAATTSPYDGKRPGIFTLTRAATRNGSLACTLCLWSYIAIYLFLAWSSNSLNIFISSVLVLEIPIDFLLSPNNNCAGEYLLANEVSRYAQRAASKFMFLFNQLLTV